MVTEKDKRLFVHVLNRPATPYVFIPGVGKKISKASLLNDSKQLTLKQQQEGIFLYLPEQREDEFDTVIQLQTQ